MYSIEVSNISKRFGDTQAVKDVSFQVRPGEIFGLLGPNGAGKTTAIRMLLDIFKPDSGSISIFGGTMTEAVKERVGYMPEDRGLYQDIPLERCLTYLGTLKGLSSAEVKDRLARWLEEFDLADHRSKKVKELSKGMQQKAQIIATLLHEPDLIVIDEPFTALDPVNTQMIKDLLVAQRDRGRTIIMCTHQMHQVEELCDRILLMNKGENMLYGDLAEIRKQFSGHAVLVRVAAGMPPLPLGDFDGIVATQEHNGTVRLTLSHNLTPQGILQALVKRNIQLEQFEVAVPDLDEIFIKVVGEGSQDE
jgi:ABC-2 type transport system ATP-binding protein